MPAVAPLAEIITLLAAMIILWAAAVIFRGFLQSLVARVPVVGGFFSSVIDLILTDASNWVHTQFDNSISVIWGMIMTPAHWIANIIDSFTSQLYSLALAARQIAAEDLPTLKLELTALVNGDLVLAEQYALSLDQQLYSILSQGLNQVYSYIGSQVTAIDSYIGSEISAVDAYIRSEISALTSYLQAQDSQLLAYIQQGLAGDEAYAKALYADAVAYAQSAVTDLGTSVTADLTGLRQWAQSQLTALQQYITAGLAAAYAYTDARVAAVEAQIEAIEEDCLDNLCENLTPLANLLSDLTKVWEITAIVALAVEFAKDPAGAAHDTVDALSDTVNGAAGVFRDAVGV